MSDVDIDYVKELPVVWLTEERKFAWLVQQNAHFVIVLTSHGETLEIENDEYEAWEERAIDYESD